MYIMHFHCDYQSGVPSSCGGATVHATREECVAAIRECIDDDIAREIERAKEYGVEPNYEFVSYDGKAPWLSAECDGYSNIDNEAVFYYITEIKE